MGLKVKEKVSMSMLHVCYYYDVWLGGIMGRRGRVSLNAWPLAWYPLHALFRITALFEPGYAPCLAYSIIPLSVVTSRSVCWQAALTLMLVPQLLTSLS